MVQEFTVVLRGYDRAQVDKVLGDAVDALDSNSAARRAAARDGLRAANFDVALRGYDRAQIDAAVTGLLRELDNLVSTDDLRATLGSVLRMSEPTDEQIVDEVRRLREQADSGCGHPADRVDQGSMGAGDGLDAGLV